MYSKLPEHVAADIREKIRRDLAPSLFVVSGKLCVAVLSGGILSLTICGQFGMGFTNWAEIFSHKIHEAMSPLLCAAICGTLFAVFPTLVLRLFLCSPLQFRMILRQRWLPLSLWYTGAAVVLATYGTHGQGVDEIVFWCLAAILTSYLLGVVLRVLIPVWSLPQNWFSPAR